MVNYFLNKQFSFNYNLTKKESFMIYENVTTGIFHSRPNRFLAHVEIDGVMEVCHVKNTGRCKELLIKGVTVVVEKSNNPNRKTKYSLIAVYKGKRLINIDSQAPNQVAYEWLSNNHLLSNITHIQREKTFGNSRFDLFATYETDRSAFIEVKGATLEMDNVVKFPDAPTQRGVKHIEELIQCKKQGFDAFILFVVQLSDVDYFTPNMDTHSEFGYALLKAKQSGVIIKALECEVTENSLVITKEIPVKLPTLSLRQLHE